MPTIIGPSFAAELKAAGVADWRFSWGTDGRIQYDPDFPDAERKKVLDVLAAHDGPLSEARHQALEATRAETSRRIAELFQQPPQSLDLVFAELNALARAVGIVEKGAGNETFAERTEIEVLKGVWGRIQAIREAGRGAKAALLAARSVEDVQAVKVEWPKG